MTISSDPPPNRPDPAWWAGALALAERLPAPAPGEDAAARARLDRWRAVCGGGLAGRLADTGLDETALLALLAEPRTRLAARTARPDWAETVDTAVAGAPAESAPLALPADPAAAFAVPLRPFIDTAAERVASACPTGVDAAAVTAGFADELATRLVAIAARTLALELNVARVSGALAGDTAAERYADFVRGCCAGRAVAALFAEYPVLARLLAQAAEHAADARAELLHRFAADRALLVKTLMDDIDPGAVVAVTATSGDCHGRGRAVASVRFADGRRVVYKPREQQMQARFADLVDWLNGKLAWLGLRVPAALVRDGYGWVEHIQARPCADLAGLDRFYRRQGALLALLYAVDGTDIHAENVIAAGDQPVLVDVETLLHPTLTPPMTVAPDPATVALTSSVLRTGLLPTPVIGDNGAMDVSGLGGDRDAELPVTVALWEATGTDEMRLGRGTARYAGAANRPSVDGVDAEPAAHQAALLAGFRAAYTAIVEHKAELLAPTGPVLACADSEIRVLVRPTRTYATLLDESTHPDVLRDALDRDAVFDLLWADGMHHRALAGLVRHEIADLWAGDIPLFTGRPGSRHVWTTDGRRVPDLLERPSADAVTAKIAAMDELDLLDQEWLIRAGLATRGAVAEHRSGPVRSGPVSASVPDPHRLLAAAGQIGNEIAARARHDEDAANWLGVEPVDGRAWAVVPMGAGLADGYTGVALFLAQLGRLTGDARYTDLALKALRPLPRLLSVLADNPAIARTIGPGAFVGLGGISYALARLDTLLDGGPSRDWLATAVELTAGADSGGRGMAAGRAGALAAMLAVHAETGLDSAAAAADTFAGRLMADADARAGAHPEADEALPSTGFGGGHAGVGCALARYGTGDALRAAHAEFAADTDPDRLLAEGNLSWCTGLAGALLARTPLGEPPAEHHVEALRAAAVGRDLSLCHGELGTLEALGALAERGSDQAAAAHARRAADVLGALEVYGPQGAAPGGIRSPGLLSGLAGIGYGLLRVGFTDSVPSVLLIEPTR
ncbi:type 2 lanthipeptide synthetase LanM family protein [Actinokineospora guangxiensis]|uniref:Type 2 lanthipeptide synthetase LanM family protein n=1 Tax=Actinokineospora guangxiensis TaxID=1490288 RepID=A0ABW0EJR7_9PSEU